MDRASFPEVKDNQKNNPNARMDACSSSSRGLPSRYVHTDKLGEKPRQFNTAAGLLRHLHDQLDCEIYTIPDAELEWFADARQNAALMAGNLGETLAQIAAFVGSEVGSVDVMKSGALQPYGLEQLLYHASDTLSIIEQMTEISGSASWALRDRWQQRARALGFKHSDTQEIRHD